MPLDELIAALRDYAEWASVHAWELPANLSEMLTEAAEELERLSEPKVLISYYDKEEIITNCTVQILTNTVTGEVSVGWWRTGDRTDG